MLKRSKDLDTQILKNQCNEIISLVQSSMKKGSYNYHNSRQASISREPYGERNGPQDEIRSFQALNIENDEIVTKKEIDNTANLQSSRGPKIDISENKVRHVRPLSEIARRKTDEYYDESTHHLDNARAQLLIKNNKIVKLQHELRLKDATIEQLKSRIHELIKSQTAPPNEFPDMKRVIELNVESLPLITIAGTLKWIRTSKEKITQNTIDYQNQERANPGKSAVQDKSVPIFTNHPQSHLSSLVASSYNLKRIESRELTTHNHSISGVPGHNRSTEIEYMFRENDKITKDLTKMFEQYPSIDNGTGSAQNKAENFNKDSKIHQTKSRDLNVDEISINSYEEFELEQEFKKSKGMLNTKVENSLAQTGEQVDVYAYITGGSGDQRKNMEGFNMLEFTSGGFGFEGACSKQNTAQFYKQDSFRTKNNMTSDKCITSGTKKPNFTLSEIAQDTEFKNQTTGLNLNIFSMQKKEVNRDSLESDLEMPRKKNGNSFLLEKTQWSLKFEQKALKKGKDSKHSNRNQPEDFDDEEEINIQIPPGLSNGEELFETDPEELNQEIIDEENQNDDLNFTEEKVQKKTKRTKDCKQTELDRPINHEQRPSISKNPNYRPTVHLVTSKSNTKRRNTNEIENMLHSSSQGFSSCINPKQANSLMLSQFKPNPIDFSDNKNRTKMNENGQEFERKYEEKDHQEQEELVHFASRSISDISAKKRVSPLCHTRPNKGNQKVSNEKRTAAASQFAGVTITKLTSTVVNDTKPFKKFSSGINLTDSQSNNKKGGDYVQAEELYNRCRTEEGEIEEGCEDKSLHPQLIYRMRRANTLAENIQNIQEHKVNDHNSKKLVSRKVNDSFTSESKRTALHVTVRDNFRSQVSDEPTSQTHLRNNSSFHDKLEQIERSEKCKEKLKKSGRGETFDISKKAESGIYQSMIHADEGEEEEVFQKVPENYTKQLKEIRKKRGIEDSQTYTRKEEETSGILPSKPAGRDKSDRFKVKGSVLNFEELSATQPAPKCQEVIDKNSVSLSKSRSVVQKTSYLPLLKLLKPEKNTQSTHSMIHSRKHSITRSRKANSVIPSKLQADHSEVNSDNCNPSELLTNTRRHMRFKTGYCGVIRHIEIDLVEDSKSNTSSESQRLHQDKDNDKSINNQKNYQQQSRIQRKNKNHNKAQDTGYLFGPAQNDPERKPSLVEKEKNLHNRRKSDISVASNSKYLRKNTTATVVQIPNQPESKGKKEKMSIGDKAKIYVNKMRSRTPLYEDDKLKIDRKDLDCPNQDKENGHIFNRNRMEYPRPNIKVTDSNLPGKQKEVKTNQTLKRNAESSSYLGVRLKDVDNQNQGVDSVTGPMSQRSNGYILKRQASPLSNCKYKNSSGNLGETNTMRGFNHLSEANISQQMVTSQSQNKLNPSYSNNLDRPSLVSHPQYSVHDSITMMHEILLDKVGEMQFKIERGSTNQKQNRLM